MPSNAVVSSAMPIAGVARAEAPSADSLASGVVEP